MAIPGDDAAAGVEAGAQPPGAGGAIVVVAQVVLARADDLHRRLDRPGDHRGLGGVVGQQAAAEAATQARGLNVDAIDGNAGHRRDDTRTRGLHLERTGDETAAIAHVRRAVDRLHRRVSEERELVVGLDHPRRALQRGLDIADLPHRCSGARRQLRELPREGRGALVAIRAFVPVDPQGIASLERGPRGVGHHRHAGLEERRIGVPVDPHHVAHARHLPRGRVVDAGRPAAEHRALGHGGELHPGNARVDAVQRLPGGDGRVVHAADPRAHQREGRNRLPRRLLRHRPGRGPRRQLAVGEAPVRGRVDHDAPLGATGVARHAPCVGRGAGQHLARGGAGVAIEIPLGADAVAAARSLATEFGTAQFGVQRPHARPVGVHFVGQDHRQCRLHALAHVRVLGPDGDGAIGVEAHEAVRLEAGGGLGRGLVRLPAEREQHAAAGERAGAEERPARDAGHRPPPALRTGWFAARRTASLIRM